MSIDFSQLQQPQIIEELDYESILAERKAAFIALYDDSDQQLDIIATLNRESEPLTKLLEENAYRELILRHRINQTARAVMLAFATGTDLDHLAANFNTQRLVISPENSDVTPALAAIYESDEALRKRVLLAFDALSVAGPKKAYEYYALSADARVADASAISPAPAEALITILQVDTEDGTATQELLDIVETALNDESIRPVADRVSVQSAQIINYQIDAKLYISRIPEQSTLLAEATQRISDYAKSAHRIGRSIYLSQLYALLTVDGVIWVEIVQPVNDILLTDEHASFCTDIQVTIAGVEA